MYRCRLALLIVAALASRAAAEDPQPPSPDTDVARQVEKLRSRYLRDREAAEGALAAMGDAVIPQILPLLSDTDPRVQRSAVAILRTLGSPAAVKPLIPLLTHPDASIASGVRAALLRAGPRIRPSLREALQDDSLDEGAVKAVRELLSASVGADIEELFSRQFTANGESGFYVGQFAELKGREEEVGPVLQQMFQGNYEWTRAGALEAKFRMLAVDALGELRIEAAVTELEQAAQNGAFGAENAAFALFKLGRPEAARALESQLIESLESTPKGQRSAVRQELAMLYARIGEHEKTIEQYQATAEEGHRNYVNHYNTACALAMLGRKDEALVQLRKAVDLGYSNLEWMQMDRDLTAIHGEPGYKEIVKDLGGEVFEESEEARPQPEAPPSGPTD